MAKLLAVSLLKPQQNYRYHSEYLHNTLTSKRRRFNHVAYNPPCLRYNNMLSHFLKQFLRIPSSNKNWFVKVAIKRAQLFSHEKVIRCFFFFMNLSETPLTFCHLVYTIARKYCLRTRKSVKTLINKGQSSIKLYFVRSSKRSTAF